MIKKTNTINNEHLLLAINTYKDKEFKSVLQFARFLYDNYYEYLNIHDENGKKTFDKNATYTGAKNNDYRYAVDIVRKEITKNLRDFDCRNSKFLYAYCIIFKCSADYLLGFIDLPTHADTDVYKKTGLAKDSIDMLSKNKNSYFPFIVTTINFLLENDEHIEDKLKLLRLIQQYILLSQNIKSYDGCGVPRMEEKDIPLYDEYGTSVGLAPIDKMSNIFLLSINELLSKLKNNISTKQLRKIPDIFDILNDILSDLICMEEIRKNIDGFNFDINNLYEINRRFKENEKRLVYLYGCDSINDIDFEIFKAKYPQYSDDKINFLKSQLNLE